MPKKNTKKPPDKLWYPTLLQSANKVNTNSWFDMNEINNQTITPQLNNDNSVKHVEYLKTIKIPLYPTKTQQNIIFKWYNAVIDAYNITNQYIKDHKDELIIERLSITNLRSLIKNKLLEIKATIPSISMHTLDYSVSHCISMYKSANTNLKNGNIKEYTIKDLSIERNRYNLVVEKQNFSKTINGFFTKTLGYMNSDKSLDNITHNCILQYHKNTKRFYLLSPTDKINNVYKKKYKKCGVDLGIRTFATIYTPDKILEIGNNTNKIIDRHNKKIDNINSQKDKNLISSKLHKKIQERYSYKMSNRIEDLYKKTAVFLTKNFDEINLGKFSIKRIISNTSSNLKSIVKRRGQTLSFFKFNEFIKIMSKKYDSKLSMTDEYKTTMTCHACKTENKNVGSSKIYNCINSQCECSSGIGRDVNAAMNIYNGGFRV